MTVPIRKATRGIVISDRDEILLMRVRIDDGTLVWITPGGGMERGETPETCLRRELHEELGLTGFHLGALLWRRDHTLNWHGRRFCQSEEYYAIHTPHFDPQIGDPVEALGLDQFRWWTLDDLRRTSDRLTPISLCRIIDDYLRDGPPVEIGHEVIED